MKGLEREREKTETEREREERSKEGGETGEGGEWKMKWIRSKQRWIY
jgi:hypothetical protein